MKKIIKNLLLHLGYELQNIHFKESLNKSSPVKDMKSFFEDLRNRGFKPETVLDVGANLGDWSRLAKKTFPKANFFLIEPQIEMKIPLENFCQEFPGSQCFFAGAADSPGVLALTIWDDLAGSSFLPKEDDSLKEKGKQRCVPVITIDQLVLDRKIPIPQFVKLDVQGFEIKVLKGADQLFGITEVFVLEVSLFVFSGHSLFHEVIRFMSDRGYFVYDFVGFMRRPYDQALGQVDVAFVKHDSFLRADGHLW